MPGRELQPTPHPECSQLPNLPVYEGVTGLTLGTPPTPGLQMLNKPCGRALCRRGKGCVGHKENFTPHLPEPELQWARAEERPSEKFILHLRDKWDL